MLMIILDLILTSNIDFFDAKNIQTNSFDFRICIMYFHI